MDDVPSPRRNRARLCRTLRAGGGGLLRVRVASGLPSAERLTVVDRRTAGRAADFRLVISLACAVPARASTPAAARASSTNFFIVSPSARCLYIRARAESSRRIRSWRAGSQGLQGLRRARHLSRRARRGRRVRDRTRVRGAVLAPAPGGRTGHAHLGPFHASAAVMAGLAEGRRRGARSRNGRDGDGLLRGRLARARRGDRA